MIDFRLCEALGAAALFAIAACNQEDLASGSNNAREVPAALALVEGLDEEGGMIGPVHTSDSVLVAFFRDHAAFADARTVVSYLDPRARADVVGGKLALDSVDTGIGVESRSSVGFVPVRAIADRFNAYARVRESPERMVTLWRGDVLCRYARNADRRANVFIEAAEQGVLGQCQPPINVTVRRWSDSRSGEIWAASATLRQPLDSAGAAALLARYGGRPYVVYGGAAGHHVIAPGPTDSASLSQLGRFNLDLFVDLRQSAVSRKRSSVGVAGSLGCTDPGSMRFTRNATCWPVYWPPAVRGRSSG